MELLMLLYLIVLGLNVGLMPRVVAVIEKHDYKASVENKHVMACILLGLVPIINVVFLFGGTMMLSTILRLHREYDGVVQDRINFNKEIKKLYDKQ